MASPPGLIRGNAPIDTGYRGGGPKDTDHVLAGSSPSSWLVDPAPRLDSADLGSDAGGVIGVELRPGQHTGRGQQDAGSRWALPNHPTTRVTKVSLGYRLPPRLETLGTGILSPTSAQGTGTVGGSLACRTHWSPLLPALRNEHAAALRGFQLLLPVKERNSWNRGQMVTAHPSERASAAWQNRRVRHQCITGSGTP